MPADELRRRALGAVAVAAAVVVWWPAFTVGVWGEVFFEQVLTLWAAATATFIVLLIGGRDRRRLSAPAVASLLLPTVWVVLANLPVDPGSTLDRAIGLYGTAITLIGLPAMVWVILQVTPEAAGEASRRTWAAAVAAVCGVAAVAFALGRLHPQFLTCRDFQVSGNSEPAGCASEAPAPQG